MLYIYLQDNLRFDVNLHQQHIHQTIPSGLSNDITTTIPYVSIYNVLPWAAISTQWAFILAKIIISTKMLRITAIVNRNAKWIWYVCICFKTEQATIGRFDYFANVLHSDTWRSPYYTCHRNNGPTCFSLDSKIPKWLCDLTSWSAAVLPIHLSNLKVV